MIVLDTHIWVWWVHGDSALSPSMRTLLDSSEQTGIGVPRLALPWTFYQVNQWQRA